MSLLNSILPSDVLLLLQSFFLAACLVWLFHENTDHHANHSDKRDRPDDE